MGFIKWILSIFLSGIGIKMRTQEMENADRERDAALGRAKSVEDAAKLEVDVIKKDEEIKKKFEEDRAKRPPDDPMGINDWNKDSSA